MQDIDHVRLNPVLMEVTIWQPQEPTCLVPSLILEDSPLLECEASLNKRGEGERGCERDSYLMSSTGLLPKTPTMARFGPGLNSGFGNSIKVSYTHGRNPIT